MSLLSTMLIFSVLAFVGVLVWIIHVHRTLQHDTRSITDEEKKITIRAEIYKTTSQIGVGFAVMAGLFITIGQFIETKSQFEQAAQNQEQQIRHRYESLALQRFDTAIENLEAKETSRRTSGVLTINAVANEFPDSYRQIANDVLIAFVRDGFSPVSRENTQNNGGVWPPRDKRLAIEVLSARLEKETKSGIQFTNLDLSAAQMPNLKVQRMSFIGSNFDGANLAKSSLIRTELNKSSLNNVNFSGADLTGSWFIEIVAREANFRAATLSGASL